MMDLLIGMDNPHLMPTITGRGGQMILMESHVGTADSNLIIAGRDGIVCGKTEVMSCAARGIVTVDFLSAEALGTEMPKRCSACTNCKECKFLSTVLTAQENAEYDVIVSNLSFNENEKRWVTSYPFLHDPHMLKDNAGQAYACMQAQEKQLIKKGKLEEFNAAFKAVAGTTRRVHMRLSHRSLRGGGPL